MERVLLGARSILSSFAQRICLVAVQTPSSIGLANLVFDLVGKDYRPSFKRIDVPTLLIVAGTAPDKNKQMQQPIPNAAGAVVDGAGHAVFYNEPTKFDDLLEPFVQGRVKHQGGR